MDIARLLNCDDSDDANRRHPHMEVARLLNHDESDQNDHKPLVGAAYSPATPPPGSIALATPSQWSGAPATSQQEPETPTSLSKKSTAAAAAPIPERTVTPAPPSIRAVARARPSRPRKPSIKSLRAQVEAFEFVVKHLPYVLRDLDDDDSSTTPDRDEDDPTKSGDHDVQRMCSFLKHTVVLSRQAQEEIAIRTEYLRLLKHHYEGTANLHKLMRGVQLDYWFWMCERWRSLTHDYYEPLLEVRAYEIVQETVQAIENHKLPDGMKESDAFGWQDWVHLDADQRYVRFMTRKTLHTDLEQLVGLAWSIYSDGDLYKMYHTGDRCELFLQVVQQISPDVMVLQSVEKYPELEQLTHSLSLVFRVQTETGYMIAVRAIESPQLLSLMKAEGISLSGNFFWDTFEVATRDGCDAVQYTLAGSIGSDNPTYARRARDEILIALVRAESRIGDPSIVAIELSTVEDNTEVSPVTNESQAIL